MMRKQHFLKTLLLLLAVTAALLAFSALRNKPATPDSACKERLEGCPKQHKSGIMDWNNLSHQFFSTI
jgi:hypothetical protein